MLLTNEHLQLVAKEIYRKFEGEPIEETLNIDTGDALQQLDCSRIKSAK
ncbi:MAG: hypothetical protein PHS05_09365 [Bacteroidales bacterium]|nr:hypothetical protein [Bacteroidales bacterium]MDY0388389.1 hypothetical protein [Methanolobus sp.]